MLKYPEYSRLGVCNAEWEYNCVRSTIIQDKMSGRQIYVSSFASGLYKISFRAESLCFFIWHPGDKFMLLILPLLSLLSLCLSVSSFRWSFLFRSLPFYCFSSVSFSIDLFCLSVSSVSSFFLVGLSCPFRLYSLFSLLFLSLGLFCFSLSVSSRSLLGIFRFVFFSLLLSMLSLLSLCLDFISSKWGLISSMRGLIPSMRELIPIAWDWFRQCGGWIRQCGGWFCQCGDWFSPSGGWFQSPGADSVKCGTEWALTETPYKPHSPRRT